MPVNTTDSTAILPPFTMNLDDPRGESTKLDRKLAPKVVRIINKYGKIAAFHLHPDKTYDPTTGKTTDGLKYRYLHKIIPPYPFEIKYVDGDLIKISDLQSGVAASGLEFTPAQGMFVIFDSQTWKIEHIKPIYSGEQVCLYLLQLRK